MKIFVPISNSKEIKPLAQAGADEFYFGISLAKSINDVNSLNARPIGTMNLQLAEAKQAVREIKSYNKKAFLCLNNRFYSKEQYQLIRKILRNLDGLDGVIAADIPMIEFVKKFFPNLEIIVSTIAHILNSRAVDFFHSLGADRFTLPRNLYFQNIIEILKKYKKYKFEIFVKSEDCWNIGGLCTYTHHIWDSWEEKLNFCHLMKNKLKDGEGRFIQIKNSKPKRLEPSFLEKRFIIKDCGLCCLFYLNQHDNNRIFLKFAGREHNLKWKLKDLNFIKRTLSILNREKGEKFDEFRSLVKKLYRNIYLKDYCHNKRCAYKL